MHTSKDFHAFDGIFQERKRSLLRIFNVFTILVFLFQLTLALFTTVNHETTVALLVISMFNIPIIICFRRAMNMQIMVISVLRLFVTNCVFIILLMSFKAADAWSLLLCAMGDIGLSVMSYLRIDQEEIVRFHKRYDFIIKWFV